MKKVYILLMLVLSLFLASCGNKSGYDNLQQIKASNLELTIPNGFESTLSGSKEIRQFKILDEYKKLSFSGFSSSLIIGKYVGEYPSNFDKFFSIVEDKFLRKIPGSSLLTQGEFNLDGGFKVNYFEYSIKNKLFEDSKPAYYGLQAYILDGKQIYVINYLSSNKNDVSNMLDLFKDIKITK